MKRYLRHFLNCLFGEARLSVVSSILFGVGVTLLLWHTPLSENSPRSAEPSSVDASMPKPRSFERLAIKLERGETLLTILMRHGVHPPSAHDLIAKIRPLLNLRKLRTGNQIDLVIDAEKRAVQEMEVPLDDNIVRAKATPEGWTVEREAIPWSAVTRVIGDSISNSLYEDGIDAGLSPEHILELAKIFEYDIDFFSDFQPGDTFSVLVDEFHYANGRRVPGKIRAAELAADGQLHRAFYFSPGPGRGDYFDGDGKQLRRAFLRAPLSYVRISSPYTLSRSHPIFRIVRPHQAIDYAAPSGTPVVAIGPGKISFSGWRLGYGNFVEIAHPGGYASRYGHFSRIANGIRRGAEVKAGDVIGFVGQTGHATGPHLHFEFLQSGQKINFLNLKIPRVEQLTGKLLEQFRRERDESLAWLRHKEPVAKTGAGVL